MNTVDGRITIYTALTLLCSLASFLVGPAAAFWTFIQISVVIEILHWLGVPATAQTDRL